MPYSADNAGDVNKVKEKLQKTYKSVSDEAARQAIHVFNSVMDSSEDEGRAWASVYSVMNERGLSKKGARLSARRVAHAYAQARSAAYIPGEVVQEGWEPGSYAPEPVPSEGSQVPPARDSHGNEVKSASSNPSDWATLFDSLRPGQTVVVAMRSPMGMSKVTDGNEHEWRVGRRTQSRGGAVQAITLLPIDGSKPTQFNAFRLWKRGDRVSASHGDMGVFLKSLRAG